MDRDLELRLLDRTLGGAIPKPLSGPKGSKTAQVTALGWRILPIPFFCREGEFIRDGKGNGNRAFIDFSWAREFLVIPPDDVDMPATKVRGPVCAIRLAYKQAMARRTGA